VLDHGRIIEAGDYTSLLAGQGRYAELAAKTLDAKEILRMAQHGAGAGSEGQLLSWSGAVSALGMLTAVIALAGPAFAPGGARWNCAGCRRVRSAGGREVRNRAGGGANC
jgi:hypothetical protein